MTQSLGMHEAMRMLSNAMLVSYLWMFDICTAKQNTDLYDFGFLTCLKANVICKQDLHGKKAN